jgi:NAD(P)-dependent dehydrogenase (short-subunit alcohol dehydrogenase family)
MVADMRTAIVTGGSRGLGRALVRTLANAGWTVVTDARDGAALAAAVSGLGPAVLAVPGDLTDPQHRAELVAAAGDRIDLLVNNAGGLGPSPLPALADFPLGQLADLFAVNVVAQLGLVQAALPRLAPGAVVVDITSDEAYAGWGGYGATKAALDHVGRVLGVEHPDLRVLTVDPGDMRTQMHQDAFPGEDISDRPPPEASVPGILALIEGDEPSGRYRVTEVTP